MEIGLIEELFRNTSQIKKRGRSFDSMRSLRFCIERFQGRLRLQTAGVTFGKGIDPIGAPLIALHADSQIRLGNNVTLISRSFATALGVNHPVVLRTLASGATIRIGSRVGISGGSICASKLIEIEDDTLLGANVTIADTDFHSLRAGVRSAPANPSVGAAEIHIGKNVFIGTGAIVLKGVSIGDRAVIGAGSIVTRDIPADCVAAGNPCIIVRMLSPYELEEGVVSLAAC